jgi:energy-coupling factor transport system permease protein
MKIHPITRLMLVISITTCSLLYQNLQILLGLLLISFFLTIINIRDVETGKKLLKQIFKLYPLFISVFLIQILFDKHGAVLFHLLLIHITSQGVETAFQVIVRLLIIAFSVGYLVKLGMRDYLSAFRLFRLPESIAVTTALTIGFLPMMSEQIRQSLQQIMLRGIYLGKLGFRKRIELYFSLIMPILGKTISNAKYQAVSLELRGFRNGMVHSNYQMKQPGLIDWVLILISIVLPVLPSL